MQTTINYYWFVVFFIFVQVALRIRPLNEDEILQGATPIAHRVDDNVSADFIADCTTHVA